jgi:putative ABC transport system permease protein
LGNDYLKPLGFATAEDAIGQTVHIGVENQVTKEVQVFDAPIKAYLNSSLVGGSDTQVSQHLAEQMIAFQNQGVPEAMTNSYAMVYAVIGGDASNIEPAKQAVISAGYDAQTVTDMLGQVKSVIDAITIVLIAFAAIALLAAAFGIINTLFMSVSERTKEIGLMKAMGMSSKKVFMMFSVEAILIGFWGSLFAISAAFGAGQVINSIAQDTFLKDLSGFTLMQYPPLSIGIVAGVIIIIAFLSGTLPASKASKMNPIDALRYE